MIKIVCDKCGRETHMKNPDLSGRAKIGFEEYDLCKYCILDIKRFINQGKADRKTENSSEKPNNCEECEHWNDAEDGCADRHGCKTEPTISKMEQVDEPTTQMKTQNSNLTFEKRTMLDCYNCKRYETEGECIECHYEPKDEPQTERSE